MLDRQETFDRVLEHLRMQREPAVRGGGLCAYRGNRGLKCAVGALIPDEKYTLDLEGHNAASKRVLSAIPGADEGDGEFLRSIQRIHDRPVMEYAPDFMAAVEENARIFAVIHSLEYDPPEELIQ